MSVVTVTDAVKKYDAVAALDGVTMTFRDGEFFGLLGPSGSGKTTLLRAIAGFVTLDRGQVLIDGQDVGGVPVHARNIGMMFQNYALFPHMSVAENVAFGLEVRGRPREEVGQRVKEALAMVRLGEIRADEREKNLHDTEDPLLKRADPGAQLDPEARNSRSTDGTNNDLLYPAMGSVGRRFGRNVPLEHVVPDTDLNAVNKPGAWGAKRSEEFNLAKEDQADDILFNEVIWRSVKGPNAKMPAPVRAAFFLPVKPKKDKDDD